MALKKGLCVAGVVCVAMAQLVAGQEPRYSQLPGSSDPFSVSTGSSFSASGARPGSGGPRVRREAITADVEEAIALITANHVNGRRVSGEALTESAINSMLHILDPHSNYYNTDEFQLLLGEHESEYTGTGSSIAAFERDGRLDTYIVSTFPGSPAARAGMRFGDRLISVDGRPVSGESPDLVRDLVRGKQGSTVRIRIERAGSLAVETVELKRDRVHEPAVPKGMLLRTGVGYIDVTNGFSNATFAEFEAALEDLKRQGTTSLVLDIRGNGGGILDQAIKVAEKFLPPGSTIVSQRSRNPGEDRTWKATKAKYESMPLVLLVDEQSASASEVLAGALQDNDRALIVGRKTFGKGLVQNVLNLPAGSGLTLTAARYYTPTGRSIQRDYAESGLYNYYRHRTAEIDKPLFAARTPTDRVVYGGDGISPDVPSKGEPLTPDRLRLLDPIFIFTRGLAGAGTSAESAKLMRHHLRSGEPADALLSEFDEHLQGDPEAQRLAVLARKERGFVVRMLAHYLHLAAFGTEAAERLRIESDAEVRRAVEALPRSAALASAAHKVRLNPRKEKSSLSLVLSEQR